MTELLPKGDAVEVYLSDETVTVPDGKVWKVTIFADATTGRVSIESASGDRESVISVDADQVKGPIQEVVLHEGWSAEDEFGDGVFLTGWQFDYAE